MWGRRAAWGLAVVVVVALAGCGGSGGSGGKRTIGGTFELVGFGSYTDDPDGCVGNGGFSDVNASTQVSLFDSTGAVVGVTQLGPGTAITALFTCSYAFLFDPINATSPFYSVEVGHRGKITKSVGDLAGAGWRFDVSLTSSGS